MNLSDQFKPSSTFSDPDSSKEKDHEARPFELSEFIGSASEKNRGFSFDSETARNFDQENVEKAKQGVKELMADAVAKAFGEDDEFRTRVIPNKKKDYKQYKEDTNA